MMEFGVAEKFCNWLSQNVGVPTEAVEKKNVHLCAQCSPSVNTSADIHLSFLSIVTTFSY
jgi:hypothetical protein